MAALDELARAPVLHNLQRIAQRCGVDEQLDEQTCSMHLPCTILQRVKRCGDLMTHDKRGGPCLLHPPLQQVNQSGGEGTKALMRATRDHTIMLTSLLSRHPTGTVASTAKATHQLVPAVSQHTPEDAVPQVLRSTRWSTEAVAPAVGVCRDERTSLQLRTNKN
jgi:hypothetical protein